ncbi:MAG: hypothetical protein JJE49_10145, partial [Peptostreptococcaceae bacterium]|nr:hypothetical protein [Peptostreptococcaceae bacterium]
MEDAISKKSDAMFREISNSRATIVIFEKYRQAKSYIDELKRDISSREMAGGLKLFLEWEKNETFTGGEVKVNNLIKFMTDASKENEFKESIKRFIQYKIDQEKLSAKEEIRDVNFEKAVFDALDYRKWFEFKIFYEKDGESKTELTPANYNVLSGGMKSTISYAPLISSLTLLMNKAQPTAPRIVALDEAFAGVDLEGADMMFEYIESLDFSYIMTSEKLTGLYPAISNISIVTYDKDVKTKEISTLKYYWSKGKHHVFPESIENIISQEAGGNN